MKGVVVTNKNAEKVLDFLKTGYLHPSFKVKKGQNFLIFPVVDDFDMKKAKPISKWIKFVDDKFPAKNVSLDFKIEAEKILSDEEKPHLKTAYDLVGKIAILEFDDLVRPKAKKVAEILLKCNKNVETVVMKKGKHEGELRIQDYEIIAGKKTMVAKHKESGCILNVELNKVYYSARSATERMRVASMVKPGEKILVMFSGCAPFVCVFAKNTDARSILGIELNKDGHKYGLMNIAENRITNAELICGDVRKVCPKLREEKKVFDRIAMPLPKTAEEFLPEAFMVSKKGTIIHLYDFVDEKEFPKSTVDKIENYANIYSKTTKKKLKYKILNAVKCGQFSPSIYRVCVDFEIVDI